MRNLLAMMIALLAASAALAQGQIPEQSHRGYQWDIDSSVTAETYLGVAFPIGRMGFDGDGTFVGELYGCDAKTYSADLCDALTDSGLSADISDTVITTGRRHYVVTVSTPAASAVVLNIHGTQNQVQQGGGGGVGGDAVLYYAEATPAQSDALVADTVEPFDATWTAEYDPADEWTTAATEICYTGSGTANILATITFSAQPASAGDIQYSVGAGPSGSLAVVSPEMLRNHGNTDAGIGSMQVGLALDDTTYPCFGLMVEAVGTGETLTINEASISITAPGAADAGATASVGGVTRVLVPTDDFVVGRDECEDSTGVDADCFNVDVTSPASVTLNRNKDGTGATWNVVAPKTTGESRCLASEATDNGSGCYEIDADMGSATAADLPAANRLIVPEVLLWDSDEDATWTDPDQDIIVGGSGIDTTGYRALKVTVQGLRITTASVIYGNLVDSTGTALTTANYVQGVNYIQLDDPVNSGNYQNDSFPTRDTYFNFTHAAIPADGVVGSGWYAEIVISLPTQADDYSRIQYDGNSKTGGAGDRHPAIYNGLIVYEATPANDVTGLMFQTAGTPTNQITTDDLRIKMFGVF